MVQFFQVPAISISSRHGWESKVNSPSVTFALKMAPFPVIELAAPTAPTMLARLLAIVPWMLTSLKAGLELFFKFGILSKSKDWVSWPNKRVICPPLLNIFFGS